VTTISLPPNADAPRNADPIGPKPSAEPLKFAFDPGLEIVLNLGNIAVAPQGEPPDGVDIFSIAQMLPAVLVGEDVGGPHVGVLKFELLGGNPPRTFIGLAFADAGRLGGKDGAEVPPDNGESEEEAYAKEPRWKNIPLDPAPTPIPTREVVDEAEPVSGRESASSSTSSYSAYSNLPLWYRVVSGPRR
jgi:hypothetical protein